MNRIILPLVLGLSMTTPAFAQGGAIMLPDPSGLTLLSLGLAGLLIGRRVARKRHEED